MWRIAVIVRCAAHVHILRNVNDDSAGTASADRDVLGSVHDGRGIERAAAIPSAMSVKPVRNHARNVRSFARWVRARESGSGVPAGSPSAGGAGRSAIGASTVLTLTLCHTAGPEHGGCRVG